MLAKQAFGTSARMEACAPIQSAKHCYHPDYVAGTVLCAGSKSHEQDKVPAFSKVYSSGENRQKDKCMFICTMLIKDEFYLGN